jgi:hypothetical protein
MTYKQAAQALDCQDAYNISRVAFSFARANRLPCEIDGGWRDVTLGPGCECGDHGLMDCQDAGCKCGCHGGKQ